jgi:hypothetical protein
MASIPTDHEPPDERAIGDLVRGLLADLRVMLRCEAELAKLELTDKASRLGAVGVLMGAAVVSAVLGLGTLIAAAVLALAIVLPAWAAAAIVGTALVLVAVVTLSLGRTRMRSIGTLAPTETLETVREDMAWIRRQTAHRASVG